MYIAPRPKANDDPYFALRLALASSLALMVGLLIDSNMLLMMPVLIISLMGGMRKAFDVNKAVSSPILVIVLISAFYWLLSYLHVRPILTLLVVFYIAALAYYITLKNGSPLGMIILIAIVMMSVSGAKSTLALAFVHTAMIEAAITTFILIPLLYWILPTQATEPLPEEYQPDSHGYLLERAVLRAAVLMALLGWMYTLLDQSNITLVITAVFTLMFPCKEHQFEEARERSYATIVGGGFALVILTTFGFVGHLSVLFFMTLIAGIFLANQMINGKNPPMVYQFTLSVMMTLICGSLNDQSPVYLTILRILLTIIGTLGAVFLYATLERLLIKDVEITAHQAKNPD